MIGGDGVFGGPTCRLMDRSTSIRLRGDQIMGRQCAWCGLMLTPLPYLSHEEISHTICLSCVEEIIDEVLSDEAPADNCTLLEAVGATSAN